MKIKEFIQRVQSGYSKGVQSVSSRLTSRHIYNKLRSSRNRILAQEFRKKKSVSDWNFQTIPCISLEEVPTSECPCTPSQGCSILRSTHKIPKILSGYSDAIKFVTAGGGKTLHLTIMDAVSTQSGNKYAKKVDSYFIHNEYLYVVSTTLIKVVSLTAIFEDPLEVYKFPSECNSNKEVVICLDPMEMELPIEGEYEDTIVELAVGELIEIFQKTQEDLTNNSRDSQKEQSK